MRWIRRGCQMLATAAVVVMTGCSAEVIAPEGNAVSEFGMLKVSGDNQVAVVGTELPLALVVKVVDTKNRPVPGQAVNFRVTSGGGTTFAGVGITNLQGIAQERWTLGTKAGPQTLEARSVNSSSGVKQTWATFTATALPDVPAVISPSAGNGQSVIVGTAVTVTPVAMVRDQYGNTVQGAAVTFVISVGTGSVTGASTVTDAAGLARPAGWTVDALGLNQLEARVGSLAAAVFTASGNNLSFALETGMPGNNNTSAVWASSSSDLWLGGGVKVTDRWDGSSWTGYANPMGSNIYSLCGVSSSAVFATGQWGVIRFDGSQWATSISGTDEIIGCWAASDTDVWAVGDGTLRHFDGVSWADIPTGLSLGFNVDRMESVWGDGQGVIYAVGRAGMLRYDGTTVTVDGTWGALVGIHGDAANDIYAVGVNGLILHYDGYQWSPMSSGTSTHLYGVFALSPRNVYAAGENGLLVRYDGQAWAPISTGTSATLSHIFALSARELYVGTLDAQPGLLRGTP